MSSAEGATLSMQVILTIFTMNFVFNIFSVYSANLEQLGNLQSLVPQGLSLSFDKVISFDSDISVLAAKLLDASSDGSRTFRQYLFLLHLF